MSFIIQGERENVKYMQVYKVYTIYILHSTVIWPQTYSISF